jgi:formyl-CoA transferase
MQVIGREDLLDDPRFSDNRQRYAHRDEVDELLKPWVVQRTKRDVMETLGRAGIPAGAVFDTSELMNDPFLRERGMFATVQHPVRGDVTMPGWPVKMSDSCVPVTAAPLLGQDNAHIYGELLGLTPDQLKTLHTEEAI